MSERNGSSEGIASHITWQLKFYTFPCRARKAERTKWNRPRIFWSIRGHARRYTATPHTLNITNAIEYVNLQHVRSNERAAGAKRGRGASALYVTAAPLPIFKSDNIPHGQKSNKLHDELRSSQQAIAWTDAETAGPTLRPARGAKQRTAGRHLEAVIRPAA